MANTEQSINIETQYVRDAEGYLIDPEDWDESLVPELATEEGIDLEEAHWVVVRFMREYWINHRVAPDVRHVVGHLVDKHGFSKKGAKEHLFKLFPYGYVKQACKIAGMKRPRAWSTG